MGLIILSGNLFARFVVDHHLTLQRHRLAIDHEARGACLILDLEIVTCQGSLVAVSGSCISRGPVAIVAGAHTRE